MKFVAILGLLLPFGSIAETTLARIFRDHMILQRDMPVPIWGWAKPGGKVRVDFAGQGRAAVAGDDGKWMLRLEPLEASAEGRVLSVTGPDRTVAVRDVLVGEVWLASGQSNMAWTVGNCATKLGAAREAVAAANYPLIRVRRVGGPGQSKPMQDLSDDHPWVVCSPQTVSRFSGVCYFFARRLHEELGVPVGFINSAWGGTPIEPYIPREAFTGHPTLETLGELGDKGDVKGVNEIEGGTFARGPHWLAGRIWNARIAPTVPFAIRGAIWYQAESNCGNREDPRHYQVKMRALIAGWRGAWKQQRLPVYYVQLPRYTGYGWTFMRDEQRRAMNASDCGMVVTHDLKLDGIHPNNKIDVGERLALWPLAKVHGREVVCSGPLYAGHRIEGETVTVRFSATDGGLMIADRRDLRPARLNPEAPLFGFELADNEGGWHQAEAKIVGREVEVRSATVSHPVGVRYAMAPQPPEGKHWNLYNLVGLPASPFCSDQSLMQWVRD